MADRHIWWFIAALVAAVLIYALIDGGEKPVQLIVEPVNIAGPAS